MYANEFNYVSLYYMYKQIAKVPLKWKQNCKQRQLPIRRSPCLPFFHYVKAQLGCLNVCKKVATKENLCSMLEVHLRPNYIKTQYSRNNDAWCLNKIKGHST